MILFLAIFNYIFSQDNIYFSFKFRLFVFLFISAASAFVFDIATHKTNLVFKN